MDDLSDVFILYDFSTKEWKVKVSETMHDYYMDVFLGFRNEGSQFVTFTEFKCKLCIRDASGSIIALEEHPRPGLRYIRSNQHHLFSSRVEVTPGAYSITVDITNAGQSSNHAVSVEIPKPPQPFPSWVWDTESKRWQPPIPYPTVEDDTLSSGMYQWNEATLSWDNTQIQNLM